MKTGQTIKNERTGEMLTMLISEEENGGALQRYRVHLPARRPSPPLHYHLAFTETFTCLEGTLDIYVGSHRQHVLLNPSQSVTVNIGQLHTFANTANYPTVMTVEAQPASGIVKAFQLAYGVANLGGAAKDGLPRNPLMRLRFIEMSQGFLATAPVSFQKTAFGLARLLANLTGLEKLVDAFCSDER